MILSENINNFNNSSSFDIKDNIDILEIFVVIFESINLVNFFIVV